MVTFEGDSALIVPVPEADPVIGEWRMLYDPTAADGVSAHVTVLYPFVPRARIDDAARAVVRTIAQATVPFDYRLAEIRWFGGDVAYLVPDPDAVFRRLTAAVWATFPDCPPYGGAHDDPIPHVTIGHAEMGDVAAAIMAIEPRLPIDSAADTMELIELAGGRWRTTAVFTFGDGR